MHLDIRYIDSSNFTRLYIEDDGSGSIKETVSGSEGPALVTIGAGGISDAQA